jgi:hypothetical protein
MMNAPINPMLAAASHFDDDINAAGYAEFNGYAV